MDFRAGVTAVLVLLTTPVTAQQLVVATPLQASIAAAASEAPEIVAFYRDRAFEPIWLGPEAAERRAALADALTVAMAHGLPVTRYDPAVLRRAFAEADESAEIGKVEVETTELLLQLARDASSGVIDPAEVDGLIRVEPVRPDATRILAAFVGSDPRAVLRGVWPSSPAYLRSLREKLRLESLLRRGGWGPAAGANPLRPGDTGPDVILLRDRLVRMEYLSPTPSASYDTALTAAVRSFQENHGLLPDGTAGEATLRAINVPVEERIAQLVVTLERLRWTNRPLELRHVLVNLAEQRAYVVDDGTVTFSTGVVVGANTPERRTPEFSETMTHMVINPSWYVPRSIAVGEYLPALRKGGARHLEIHSSKGRVDPSRVDWSRIDASSFPFSLRQAPGPSNALGRVKFMFPNPLNIYLHDTPARDLFAREIRTFSHGCVRVERPLELAYHLLAPQTETPREDFDAALASGRERRVDLEEPIGVHLVYWNAWVGPDGRAQYRNDPYGRDARLRQLLSEAGVELTLHPS